MREISRGGAKENDSTRGRHCESGGEDWTNQTQGLCGRRKKLDKHKGGGQRNLAAKKGCKAPGGRKKPSSVHKAR